MQSLGCILSTFLLFLEKGAPSDWSAFYLYFQSELAVPILFLAPDPIFFLAPVPILFLVSVMILVLLAVPIPVKTKYYIINTRAFVD
jgi:hypothetical protein|nr:hypothetical protein [Proteiniphilum sp. UBA5218]